MDPAPSVMNSTLICRKVTHSESGTACPRWTHKSLFACIILPPYLVPVWLPHVAMSYSIVAFQLKAANTTVCVTDPLKKSAPLLQKPNQGVKSSPVLLHQNLLAVLCFPYTWHKPLFPKSQTSSWIIVLPVFQCWFPLHYISPDRVLLLQGEVSAHGYTTALLHWWDSSHGHILVTSILPHWIRLARTSPGVIHSPLLPDSRYLLPRFPNYKPVFAWCLHLGKPIYILVSSLRGGKYSFKYFPVATTAKAATVIVLDIRCCTRRFISLILYK